MALAIGLAVLLALWYVRAPVADGVRWAGQHLRKVPVPGWSAEVVHALLLIAVAVSWTLWLSGRTLSPLFPVDPNNPVVTPDTPDEPVQPGVPVSFDGFRVLVLSETEPEQQQLWFTSIMASAAVDEYLDTHCDGGMAGWRHWDDDLNPQNAPGWLKEMHAVPDAGSPSVTIAARGQAQSFPVPQTEAEFLELLKRFGGQ